MFENFKLTEFLNQIKTCKEKEIPIEIKGFGFNNCPYAKIMYLQFITLYYDL